MLHSKHVTVVYDAAGKTDKSEGRHTSEVSRARAAPEGRNRYWCIVSTGEPLSPYRSSILSSRMQRTITPF
jgi:hypothetical protein